MLHEGYIGNLAAEWLNERFEKLKGVVQEGRNKRAFLHGDNHTGNIMVDKNQFVALIDWGDACWGDPASDFMYIPSRAVSHTIEGYRSVSPVDESMELRILHYHLVGALYRLKRDPTPQLDDWATTPGSRVFELLAAMVSSPLESWTKLLR